MAYARELRDYEVRFDYKYPAFTQQFFIGNKNLYVDKVTTTPFGAKFRIRNKLDIRQLIGGTAGSEDQSFRIFGQVLHEGPEAKVEQNITSVNNVSDVIEFNSDWIQNRLGAMKILNFAVARMENEKKELNVQIVGNPLIEVADVVTVQHGELGLNGNERFIVYAVTQSWNDGLETTIKAYEI